MVLRRRLAEEIRSAGDVLLYAFALQLLKAIGEHRLGIALCRAGRIPARGFGIVLLDPKALLVELADERHRSAVMLIRGNPLHRFFQRGLVIATLIGAEGEIGVGGWRHRGCRLRGRGFRGRQDGTRGQRLRRPRRRSWRSRCQCRRWRRHGWRRQRQILRGGVRHAKHQRQEQKRREMLHREPPHGAGSGAAASASIAKPTAALTPASCCQMASPSAMKSAPDAASAGTSARSRA